MTRALFDRSAFGAPSFDSAFEQIFGVRPRTVGEVEAADADDTPELDGVPRPVSQRDEE